MNGGAYPRRASLGLMISLLLLLAACQSILPGSNVPATPLPTPVPLYWDERAAVTLIQADRLTLPLAEPDKAAFVPTCAIYGDRRARWLEPPPDGAPAGATGRLLESPVDAERLAALVRTVAESGFFGMAPVYGVESGPVRRLAIRLEGLGQHAVQVSDATVTPPGFDDLFALCEGLRQPDAAQEVLPDGGWLYAFEVPAPGAAQTLWPDDAGWPLTTLAEGPRWLQGDLASQVWTQRRDYGAEATFGFLDKAYRVVLRVPGVTPDTLRQPRNPDEAPPPSSLWTAEQLSRVFVARLTGGTPIPSGTIGANIVDACTIYGDGRVVISEQPVGRVQEGRLTPQEMDNFLEGWINTGFFDFSPEAPTATPPPAETLVQEVSILLNDGREATRRYPLGAGSVRTARNPCATLTEFQPAEPQGGYLWAIEQGPSTRYEDNPDYLLVAWPEEYVELEEFQQPVWQEDDPDAGLSADGLRFAWETIHAPQRRPNLLFVQRGLAYQVNVDVPDITTRLGGVLGAIATEEPAAQ
jgi:hypothetical protein